MLAPSDEQINISPSIHSIAVSRAVTVPGYTFPNESIFDYQKPFLSAGMRGLHGCGGCGKGLGGMSTPMLLGLAAVAVVFLLPPKYSRF